jgi:hypothetical protein
MHIYSSEASFFFSAPYNAKRLLDDSVERTLRGYSGIREGAIVTGFGNILLSRVESATAFSFVALSATFLTLGGVIVTPCFLIPATVLTLISRIPGISSFESVQNFTRESSNAIYRTLRIYLVAIPVIFLFLSASGVNTFLPGVLKPQNLVFNSIHGMVESLGSLQTIRAIVPNVTEVVGTETEMSALAGAEEYFRALSSQNYLREVRVSSLTHHYSYTRSY